jgi:hypothetical protein
MSRRLVVLSQTLYHGCRGDGPQWRMVVALMMRRTVDSRRQSMQATYDDEVDVNDKGRVGEPVLNGSDT